MSKRIQEIQQATNVFEREFKIFFFFLKNFLFASYEEHSNPTPAQTQDTPGSPSRVKPGIRSPTRSLLKIQFSDGERSAFPVRRMMTFLPFLCLYCLETACTGGGRDPNGSGGSGYGAYYIR